MIGAAWAGRKLHFIGIGGAGMSGLALVAHALGAEVSGSDQSDSSYCARLREAGITPTIGHDAALVPADAEVVISSAIPPANAELAVARSRGTPVQHRGELLGELSRLKRCIAVAGAHGKTTSAGMVAHALAAAGRSPSYLIGGESRLTGANAAWGEGDWLVVEADESDRSFLELAHEVAVVTNVELDHHAAYRSLAELEQAFSEFASRAAVRIFPTGITLPGPAITFGLGAGDLAAESVELLPLGSRFTVEGQAIELRVPGAHNVLNALAALAACRAAGLDIAAAAPSLIDFQGTTRRFELLGKTVAGARVVDDYAHHPTELRATLEAARTLGAERVIACFQPHLYSRTRHLAREFGRALALADIVVVVDVYAARERAEDFPDVSGWLIAAQASDAARGRAVHWLPALADAERLLRMELREGDLLLTLGAGDINKLAERLLEDRVAAPAPLTAPARIDGPSTDTPASAGTIA